MRARVDATFVVTETPNLVFGGVSESFFHASATEQFLVGKSLNDDAVLSEALSVLDGEVQPDADPVLASPEYRKHLVKALFYKVRKKKVKSLSIFKPIIIKTEYVKNG